MKIYEFSVVVGPTCNHKCPYKEGGGGRWTAAVRDVKMEARGWGRGPQPSHAGSLQKLKNAKKQVLPRVFGGSPADASKTHFRLLAPRTVGTKFVGLSHQDCGTSLEWQQKTNVITASSIFDLHFLILN